jgi:hypothetical protein
MCDLCLRVIYNINKERASLIDETRTFLVKFVCVASSVAHENRVFFIRDIAFASLLTKCFAILSLTMVKMFIVLIPKIFHLKHLKCTFSFGPRINFVSPICLF